MDRDADGWPHACELEVIHRTSWRRPMRKHGRRMTARERRASRRRLIRWCRDNLGEWRPPLPDVPRWPHKQERRTVPAWEELPF
jgi:hypothetical protein